MRSFALRPGNSLILLNRTLSVGFNSFITSTAATLAKGTLTFTLGGLNPPEYTSLRWTHNRT